MAGWSTRRQVREQPFTQYDETGLQELLESLDRRMTALCDEYIRMMGEHVYDIGTMWPSDVHRLQQIRRMNRNLAKIRSRIAQAASRSEQEIEDVFREIAQTDARMEQRILGQPDAGSVTENEYLSRILRAQARETLGRLQNLSNTTVESAGYQKLVDRAVNAVQSGVEDYGSAIRRTLREAGSMGLRIRDDGTAAVGYASGRTMRLDSAVRMNILDGVRHLNQSIMEEVGREFGADGVEIDAHMLCAEDHLPYQGGQYTNEEFEEIQDSLQRPFGEWNCRHSWHPILMGISPKTYTDEQLREMEEYSREEIEIDGKTKTRYEWSQAMRRMETAIRREKDIANLAEAAGDKAQELRSKRAVPAMVEEYGRIANKTGIRPEFSRTYVQGYRDEKERDLKVQQISSTIDTEIRYKKGSPVTFTEKTLDMSLDRHGYALFVAAKYNIHLRGSGRDISIVLDDNLVEPGKTAKARPFEMRLGRSAFINEEELARTIAHELNHCRQYLKYNNAPEKLAYRSEYALRDYIRGLR